MSVYKRGDKGVFYMNITVNCERINKSTGKFTKKEAKLVEALEKKRLMEEAALSPTERKAKVTLSMAIKKVYDERWKDNKDGYGSNRNAEMAMQIIGDIPISKIDEDAISLLIRRLEARKIKPATVNRYLASLKTVLRHNKQPSDFFRKKKEPKGRIRVLTKIEEQEVLRILKSTRLTERNYFYPEVADLVEVLADTGMRLSEAINLHFKDVNFKANLISIWVNKGELPRSLPMTIRVKTILEARMEINKVRPFTITKHQAGHAWNMARKHMGLLADKEFVMHSLRHTCASRLVNAGVDLYVVKEWLGHSSIQVTEKYAHLSPNKLAHAATILDEYE
jgi:integrase